MGLGSPLDSLVLPIFTEFSLESGIGGAFYEQDLEAARANLTKDGFVDVDGDGVPNDDVEVDILTPDFLRPGH